MAFGFMVDHFFSDDHLALPAIYYPNGTGEGSPVRVIFRQPDEAFSLGGFQTQARVYTLDIRVSEITAPKIGDRLLLNGKLYEISAEPKADPMHLIWSCGVRPV